MLPEIFAAVFETADLYRKHFDKTASKNCFIDNERRYKAREHRERAYDQLSAPPPAPLAWRASALHQRAVYRTRRKDAGEVTKGRACPPSSETREEAAGRRCQQNKIPEAGRSSFGSGKETFFALCLCGCRNNNTPSDFLSRPIRAFRYNMGR